MKELREVWDIWAFWILCGVICVIVSGKLGSFRYWSADFIAGIVLGLIPMLYLHERRTKVDRLKLGNPGPEQLAIHAKALAKETRLGLTVLASMMIVAVIALCMPF